MEYYKYETYFVNSQKQKIAFLVFVIIIYICFELFLRCLGLN